VLLVGGGVFGGFGVAGVVEVGGCVGLVLGEAEGELGFDGVVLGVELGLAEFGFVESGLVLFGFALGIVLLGFVEVGLFGEVVSGVDGVCCVCGVPAGEVVEPG
jgi:hypothetical protein